MSRKYRQRGYQDEDERPSRKGSAGPRERSEGPRGRGLGKPTATVFRCARCGAGQAGETVEPTTSCASCGSDLHTCTNCRFFDTGAPNECRAEVEVRIARKSSRNDCTLFEAKVASETSAEKREPGDPRSEFDSLFNF